MLTTLDNTIIALRPGQRPTIVQVIPPAHSAYVTARVEAHQTIAAGELSVQAARQLAQMCRLITLQNHC